ncbi:two-component system sensor histidine kinase MtrB [Conyzicola nivalis]|uniref:Sensor histidine kinase MtrB n=1 Tax=Conyzicola nivalis TaxID=1477021 RepID=A0ABV2QQX9_9MICO
MRYLTWRAWLLRLERLWRSSLQWRTVAISVALCTVAVGVIGLVMSYSINTNLFNSRVNDALAASERSNIAAQVRFDAAQQSSSLDLETAMSAASNAAIQASLTPAGTEIAILRTPGQSGPRIPVDLTTRGLDPETTISPELRESVESSSDGRQYWQSVSLDRDDGGVDPGIVVGSLLDVPTSGQYELYLVYNLSDTQQVLSFVQGTLWLGLSSLVVLIGAVTFTVVRLIVAPVRLAAETSEKLAAGQLEVRIPERGEDVIATLARSFNGMADSLQKQITKLAALSQVQQRFVSDVSHELRTPLTTIRLAGDVLYDQRDTFPPATARTTELLHTQVQRFELLLADLLEMSRYDAGAVDMEVEPTNLVRLVEDAIDSVQTLSASKGTELRLDAPGGYFQADVDSRRIRRILQNLLANAIDHGEGRPIVVYVDSNATAVAIAVRDYGIGMTSAAMERVFDRFWRADPSRQRSTGGTGLGLAISLEDAALHGGWLEVWSAPGEGSCFRLTLPRVRGTVITESPLELPPVEAATKEDADV